jgi:hypothetical protein
MLLVSCVIERAGDFLHETPPRALDLKEKWRRSYRKRRPSSMRGDDRSDEMRICQSANPWLIADLANPTEKRRYEQKENLTQGARTGLTHTRILNFSLSTS